MVSRCVLYIMGRAIVIAVLLQSDPSIKMYMGLSAGKQLNQEHTTHPIRHIRESELMTNGDTAGSGVSVLHARYYGSK
jgi:hypothetical protein